MSASTPDKTGLAIPYLLGKREANKLDKVQRIRRAAHELFSVNGYDETTMRDIAKRANIALGTLFLYVSNKRDLLFLIANDVLESLVEQATLLTADDDDVMIGCLTITVLHFRAFGLQPTLSRLVLREMLFYDTGEHAERAIANRENLLRLYCSILVNGQKHGQVRPSFDVDQGAWLLFSVQQAEVRRWLWEETTDLSAGIRRSWANVQLIVRGISTEEKSKAPSDKDQRILIQRAMQATIHQF